MIATLITSVRDAKWSDESRKTIDCIVTTNLYKKEMPFTASPLDTEAHGRDLFARLKAGDFGEIDEPTNADMPDVEEKPADETGADIPLWITEFIQEANQENQSGSVRGMALVSAALLEAAMQETIPEGKRKPNSNLGNKINELISQGLITGGRVQIAKDIRESRNDFAHRLSLSFDDLKWKKSINERLGRLNEAFEFGVVMQDDLQHLIRHVFSPSCTRFGLLLWNEHQRRSALSPDDSRPKGSA